MLSDFSLYRGIDLLGGGDVGAAASEIALALARYAATHEGERSARIKIQGRVEVVDRIIGVSGGQIHESATF